jgi:hypothetical protein
VVSVIISHLNERPCSSQEQGRFSRSAQFG